MFYTHKLNKCSAFSTCRSSTLQSANDTQRRNSSLVIVLQSQELLYRVDMMSALVWSNVQAIMWNKTPLKPRLMKFFEARQLFKEIVAAPFRSIHVMSLLLKEADTSSCRLWLSSRILFPYYQTAYRDIKLMNGAFWLNKEFKKWLNSPNSKKSL